MRRALEYTSMFDVPILDHCEDANLAENGQMRDGLYAVRLGLKGIPSAAESIQVARDIDLAECSGGHVHICHISVRKSLEYVQSAKQRGVKVTCEVTPHHLTLTDAALLTYDPNFKMRPPLGSELDRRALVEGLKNGVIDCIATDHAPHTDMDKDQVMADAPSGVIGLESAFPVLYTDLVMKGEISLGFLIEKMTWAPSKILRLSKGTLGVGQDGDITILDLDTEFVVDPSKFLSRSRNCPFAGKRVQGLVVATIVGGKIIYQDGRIRV
jgi:dihydroorotase